MQFCKRNEKKNVKCQMCYVYGDLIGGTPQTCKTWRKTYKVTRDWWKHAKGEKLTFDICARRNRQQHGHKCTVFKLQEED